MPEQARFEPIEKSLRGHTLKGMRVEVRFWIRDPMNGVNNVRSDVNREIWRLFKKHGITIPVQQHDVRLLQREPDFPGQRR